MVQRCFSALFPGSSAVKNTRVRLHTTLFLPTWPIGLSVLFDLRNVQPDILLISFFHLKIAEWLNEITENGESTLNILKTIKNVINSLSPEPQHWLQLRGEDLRISGQSSHLPRSSQTLIILRFQLSNIEAIYLDMIKGQDRKINTIGTRSLKAVPCERDQWVNFFTNICL